MTTPHWKDYVDDPSKPCWASFVRIGASVEHGRRTALALGVMQRFCEMAGAGNDPMKLPLDRKTLDVCLEKSLGDLRGQMRKKAVALVRSMLRSVDELGPIVDLMPRFARRRVDPLLPQRHVCEGSALPRPPADSDKAWVNELLSWLMRHPARGKWATSATVKQTMYLVRKFLSSSRLLECQGRAEFDQKIADLTLAEIDQLLTEFTETLGPSRSSVKRYTYVFNFLFVDVWQKAPKRWKHKDMVRKPRVWTDAEIEEALSSGASDVDAPLRRVKHFQSSEVDRILSANQDSIRNTLIGHLLFSTGLRAQSVLNILVDRIARWDEPNKRWEAYDESSTLMKGKRLHEFQVLPPAARSVERWLNTPEQQGGRPVTPSAFLFPSGTYDNGQMSTATLRRIFREMCHKAGFEGDKRCHPHTARHSYAHELVDAGNQLPEIAAALGHRNIQTTTIYTKQSAEDLRRKLRVAERFKCKDNDQQAVKGQQETSRTVLPVVQWATTTTYGSIVPPFSVAIPPLSNTIQMPVRPPITTASPEPAQATKKRRRSTQLDQVLVVLRERNAALNAANKNS